jgi:hypothetical protein
MKKRHGFIRVIQVSHPGGAFRYKIQVQDLGQIGCLRILRVGAPTGVQD